MTPKKNVGNPKNAKKCCDQNCPRRGLKDPDFHRLRPRQNCLRISDLVYKFLEDVASLNDEKRQRNNARTNFQRTHVRKYNRQSRKPDAPKITDEIFLQSRYQMPKNCYLESNFNNWPSMEKEKILEDCDATELLENKSSSQFVEDYVKAVNESKRRAERYISKALSFGVEAGFLVPGLDSEGHVLRVSSALKVNIFDQNMDCGNETETDDRENREICFCHRGNRQNSKSDVSMSCSKSIKKRSKSRSKKSKNKEKELKSKAKKRICGSRPAKKRRGKSIGRNKPKDNKPEANDSDDSDTEKSLSGFTNEGDNITKSTNSDASLKSSNKKRRVTDSDKNPKDVEVTKNDDEENHEKDASEVSDYKDNQNHETKNN